MQYIPKYQENVHQSSASIVIMPFLVIKILLLSIVKAIDAVLTVFTKINFIYIGVFISLILGYVFGVSYLEYIGKQFFTIPSKTTVLQHINSKELSADRLINAHLRVRPNADIQKFTNCATKRIHATIWRYLA